MNPGSIAHLKDHPGGQRPCPAEQRRKADHVSRDKQYGDPLGCGPPDASQSRRSDFNACRGKLCAKHRLHRGGAQRAGARANLFFRFSEVAEQGQGQLGQHHCRQHQNGRQQRCAAACGHFGRKHPGKSGQQRHEADQPEEHRGQAGHQLQKPDKGWPKPSGQQILREGRREQSDRKAQQDSTDGDGNSGAEHRQKSEPPQRRLPHGGEQHLCQPLIAQCGEGSRQQEKKHRAKSGCSQSAAERDAG